MRSSLYCLALALLTSGCDRHNRSEMAAISNPAQIAANALAECDRLASHPKDNGRTMAAISDEQLAPGIALPACQKAVELNDDNPRAHFELGRIYGIMGRNQDAFDSFAISAGGNYPIAMKYIGDAYLEKKGLPDNSPKDDAELYKTARDWYQKSADAGYQDGINAVSEADALIRSATFNPALFQNPSAIKAIYDGDFLKNEDAVLNAYYAKGLVQQMDDNDQFFMDPECKPLLYKISNLVVDVEVMAAYAGSFRSGGHALGAGIGYLASSYAMDMGKRDAINLMNIHKCNSSITQKIIDNIILTNKGPKS